MNKYHIWIGVLLEEYEPIITNCLKAKGYDIKNQDTTQNILSSQKALQYTIETSKSIERVEYEVIYDVLRDKDIKYHFALVSNSPPGLNVMWRGSNINYEKIKEPHPMLTLPKTIEEKELVTEEIDIVNNLNDILDHYTTYQS